MKTEQEFINFCLARLAAEGIEAFPEMEVDDDGDELGIRVRIPAWERDNAERTLCRRAVYDYFNSKLDGQHSKGLLVSAPGLSIVDVYCYYPPSAEAGKKLDKWDLRVWSVGAASEKFDWAELIEGDDAAWWDGWDAPSQLAFVSQRMANIATFLNYQIIDLPPVQPLTRQELVDRLQRPGYGDSIVCDSGNIKDIWRLRLNTYRDLVLHKQQCDSITPVLDHHFDKAGRLVIDGVVALHRCYGL